MRYDLEEIATPGSGVRKAAILVLTLGDDLARDIFTRLSETEIRMLGEVARQLDDIEQSEVISVMREFQKSFHGGIPHKGIGGAFHMMVESALGAERANNLFSRREQPDDPFEVVNSVDAQLLASILFTEHPQTIAIVLASVEPKTAAAVLESFQPELAADVVYRLAHMSNISEDVRTDVGSTLVEELAAMGTLDAGSQIDGESIAVEVTKAMPQDLSNQMLDDLEANDEEFAQHLRSKLFIFEDLGKLDARTMQRLLREVDSRQLMVAMKGCSEDLQNLIFGSMSQRAAEMLREDMSASPPVRVADVEVSQTAILEIAFRLETEGAIALPRGGGELL